jgi:hypothetical protein
MALTAGTAAFVYFRFREGELEQAKAEVTQLRLINGLMRMSAMRMAATPFELEPVVPGRSPTIGPVIRLGIHSTQPIKDETPRDLPGRPAGPKKDD